MNTVHMHTVVSK